MSALRYLILVPLIIIGVPLYIAFMLVFLALWLVLILTGVGPIAHCLGSRSDAAKLGALCKAGGPVTFVNARDASSNRRLAIRWTPGKGALPPVCIPNGLGATLISIGSLHDRLAELGFPVLSYDRAGVGLSDCLPPSHKKATGRAHANAQEVVDDMKTVMDSVVDPSSGVKWLLIGPSMGSIVAQAFIAVHPGMVGGFLNMDGFPFPFAAKRRRFELAGYIYRFYAAVVPTGILRPFLYLASGQFKDIATPTFPVPIVRAQINEANFFASLAREMSTMMDCADFARAAWGSSLDLQTWPKERLLPLINAQPHAYGAFTNDTSAPTGYTWAEEGRSKWERGDTWCRPEETSSVLQAALQASASEKPRADGVLLHGILPSVWPKLAVRVMSARNYGFPGGDSFYDDEMKDWAAAEHTLHAQLAQHGRRTAFPTRHHGQMFFGVAHVIAQHAMEVAQDMQAASTQA